MFLWGNLYTDTRPEKKFDFVHKLTTACYSFEIRVGSSGWCGSHLSAELQHGIGKHIFDQLPIKYKVKSAKNKRILKIISPNKRKGVLLYLKTVTSSDATGFGTVYYKNDYEITKGSADELWGKYPKYFLKMYAGSHLTVGGKELRCYTNKSKRVELKFL